MIVKPRNPSHIIRDPHTKRPLPADGGRVPDTNFWRRRLLCGDVVETTLPSSSSAPSKTSKSSKAKESKE